jgi:pimeloyl-ACP methyl ester carboxylesterase/DNA-binding CsgD family transcriptional regulator
VPTIQPPMLTHREQEVAELIAQGLTNRQIADRLFISERTAEHHAEQIRGKLGFHSRAQIASWVAGSRPPQAGTRIASPTPVPIGVAPGRPAGPLNTGAQHRRVVPPPVQYARSGSVNIAYQVVGDGPVDLLMIPGWVTHLTLEWEEPTFVHFMERLTAFARVVRFDKRGTGLSDRPPGVPTLEERMEDAHCVLEAAGLERAVILGWSEGGPMAVLFAATHPERTTALVLYGTQARFVRAPDYPFGPTPEEWDSAVHWLEAMWGREVVPTLAPSDDERYRTWLLRYEQAGTSPATAATLQLSCKHIDVRDILPSIHVPTLVLNRRGDPVGPGPAGRYMAERIRGAKFVELEGDNHTIWLGDVNGLTELIEEFLTGQRQPVPPDRFLSTILIADVERSTDHLVRMGDARWGDFLQQIHVTVERELGRFGGSEIHMVGDELVALFDGPVRAIRCAAAIQRQVENMGVWWRAGVHTGEVERANGDIGGLALHVAGQIAALAKGGEILVSGTVRDIVAGSGLAFADVGVHALKGVPEPRHLFRVT